jgi:hypothetical protein
MSASNSKLSAVQKSERRRLLAALPKGSVLAMSECGVTVLTIPDGAVTRMYTSVASQTEKKLRRKVGEYNVLMREYHGGGDVVLQRHMDAEGVVVDLFGGVAGTEDGMPFIRYL